MTDDLHARLRAANPVPARTAVEPADSLRTRNSMEAAMSSNSTEDQNTSGRPDTLLPLAGATTAPVERRSRWFPIGIAAAAAGVILAGSLLVPDLIGDDDAGSPAALTLSLPAGNAAASCVQITPEILGTQEIAFAGTATSVTDSTVGLQVDSWYRGGDGAAAVELAYGASMVEDGLEFEVGHHYLISGSDGTVSTCGFSGETSPELETLFQQAFPQAG